MSRLPRQSRKPLERLEGEVPLLDEHGWPVDIHGDPYLETATPSEAGGVPR